MSRFVSLTKLFPLLLLQELQITPLVSFTFAEDSQFFNDTANNYLDIFVYSSISGALKNVPSSAHTRAWISPESIATEK